MKNKTLVNNYPSFDLPWLKHYKQGSLEAVNRINPEESLFDFLEDIIKKQGNTYPALEYFGRKISRQTFLDESYAWAKVLRNMGVKAGDVIPVYTLWVPEVCYLLMAMNMIGATPYFLKLQISEEALEDETSESDFVIVLDILWANVDDVFSRSRFKKVMFITITDSLPWYKRMVMEFFDKKRRSELVNNEKYFFAKDAKRKYAKYNGEVKNPVAYRYNAFISSSSGTTSSNVVKGIIASDRAAIAQCIMAKTAEVNYLEGKRVLANLPPTAATSLICLFIYPLVFNQTVIVDPQLSEEGYYDTLMKLKPQVSIMTGSFWMSAFRKANKELEKGNKVDLSFLDMPIMGGEGSTKEDLEWMNSFLKKCGSKVDMFSGYGMSEMCSVFAVDKLNEKSDEEYEVNTVGLPYPNVVCGVFDDNGEELPYGERGELWVKSDAIMVGYYGKDELTERTVVNGWMKTGDIFRIDKEGYMYFYGRKQDYVMFKKEKIYLFDISNAVLENRSVRYALAIKFELADGSDAVVCHIVLRNDEDNKIIVLKELEEKLKTTLPEGMKIDGYKFHHGHLAASPTTAKVDRYAYSKELDGYVRPVGEVLVPVSYKKVENGIVRVI